MKIILGPFLPLRIKPNPLGRGIVDPSFVLAASMIILGGLPRLEANCWCENHSATRFESLWYIFFWFMKQNGNRKQDTAWTNSTCVLFVSTICGSHVSSARSSADPVSVFGELVSLPRQKNIISFLFFVFNRRLWTEIVSSDMRSNQVFFPTYERTFLNRPWKHNTRKSKQPLCQSSWSSHTNRSVTLAKSLSQP